MGGIIFYKRGHSSFSCRSFCCSFPVSNKLLGVVNGFRVSHFSDDMGFYVTLFRPNIA